MKNFLLLASLFFITSIAAAQPCKTVKPGMTRLEVIQHVGAPEKIDVQGPDNGNKGTDTLAYWNYGNQQVVFHGGKVDRIKVDVKKEDELAKKLSHHEINQKEFSDRLKKINLEGCK